MSDPDEIANNKKQASMRTKVFAAHVFSFESVFAL